MFSCAYILLSIFTVPTFLSGATIPPNTTLVAGEKISIKGCSFMTGLFLTPNDVLWLKDGVPFQNVVSLKENSSNNWTMSNLEFRRAALNDSGLYQCAINISISPLIISERYLLSIDGKYYFIALRIRSTS